ncbi:DUF5518 domain-containing protein [Methanobacterium lacus]|nr:DUF5518 domain-containing protein [Methanobacterium lacus]
MYIKGAKGPDGSNTNIVVQFVEGLLLYNLWMICIRLGKIFGVDNNMLNWKYIFLGATLVVVLGLFLRIVEYGTFIGMFVPGIIVGYLVNNDYKNGAKNGIITGIIGGFILGILLVIPLLNLPSANHIIFYLFVGGIINAIFTMILDAIGGIIGVIIRNKIY